ncbi:MAG: T9SS type A sorting domain-containing protein [Tenuifilaceae bacterium]
MPNKYFFVILFCIGSFSVTAQSRGEEYPFNIDSSRTLLWSSGNLDWEVYVKKIYEYSQDKITKYVNINPISLDPISSWEYFYDSLGNRNYDLFYQWKDGIKILVQKNTIEYNKSNQKTIELTSNLVGGVWVWRANQIFEYNGDKLVKAVYQLKDRPGTIYDYTHTIYHYENDNLSEVITKRGLDGFVIKIAKYSYDNFNRLTEILYFEPFKEANSSNYQYIQTTRRNYTYDLYTLLIEVRSQKIVNNNWVNYAKEVYFNRIDNAQKVSICHNGKTLSVSKNAVLSHLKHGDYLGKCTTSLSTNTSKKEKKESFSNKIVGSIGIYPNPAQNTLTVLSVNQEESIRRIDIYDLAGTLVYSSANHTSNNVNIDISIVPAGIYILKALSGDTVYQEKFVKQ